MNNNTNPLHNNFITRAITFLVLIAVSVKIECRAYTNDITLASFRRNGGWHFLDRMVFGKGTATAKLNVKFISRDIKDNSSFALEVAFVDDSLWASELFQKCSKLQQSALTPSDTLKHEIMILAELTPSNNYSFEKIITFSVEQQKAYHYVLKDCQKSILKDYFNRDSRIQIQLVTTNNGSHHSETEKSYQFILPLLLIFTCVLIYYANKSRKQFKLQDSQETWTAFFLRISLYFSLFSVLFKYLGYLIYVYGNGRDYSFFDFVYLLLHSFADSILSTLLVFLAFGWTVTFYNSRDFDLYVPLISMLGLVNVIMSMLNKITDGEHDKYHMYDSVPAYIMLFFKFLSIILFVVGMLKSLLNIKKESQTLRGYFLQLGILGFIYLSIIPLSMYLITFFGENYRKDAIFILIEVVKNAINAALIQMSCSKASTYVKLSQASFMEKQGKYY